ncbi:MAG TPA: hypothetical protein VGC60_19170, partial [Pyrinomonadaceae bacterium]
IFAQAFRDHVGHARLIFNEKDSHKSEMRFRVGLLPDKSGGSPLLNDQSYYLILNLNGIK